MLSSKSAKSALINLADDSDDSDNLPMKAVKSHSLFEPAKLLLEWWKHINCNEKEKLLLFVEHGALHPYCNMFDLDAGLIGWVNTIIIEHPLMKRGRMHCKKHRGRKGIQTRAPDYRTPVSG
eukprot:4499624-Ditylum_brightwellii.AAC.1